VSMRSHRTPSLTRESLLGRCNRASIILPFDILTATLSGVAHTFHLHHWLLRRLIRGCGRILPFHSKSMLHIIPVGRLQIRAVKTDPANGIFVPPKTTCAAHAIAKVILHSEGISGADGEAVREGVEGEVTVGGARGGRSEANVVFVLVFVAIVGTEEPRGFTSVRVGLEG